ncbi:hypothetical protein [Rhodanobacter sp. C03]|uniref:hypothetical protein n=1 Tax=Rhodanobacter sp. C03 TaxID=1945858 RepID=UPI0011154E89|nr:hypothetical protein [Rhodanobacter sp. C03]
MMRILLSMMAMVAATVAYAQDRTPIAPSGTRVTTQTVQLLTGMPAACVSLAAEHTAAMIVLPRDELDRLAAPHTPVEEAGLMRLDLLAESRAREFLKTLGKDHDDHGCVAVRGKVSMDTGFLIGWLLEHGHALVITKRMRLPEPVVIVRHTDTRLFGYEEFLLTDDSVIWGYGTWVS